jgi:hypothetical protein
MLHLYAALHGGLNPALLRPLIGSLHGFLHGSLHRFLNGSWRGPLNSVDALAARAIVKAASKG